MKNLINEIFNHPEIQCLITEQYDPEIMEMTKKTTDKVISENETTTAIYRNLNEQGRLDLENAITDNVLLAILDAFLMGYKDGFNTSQELNGGICLK